MTAGNDKKSQADKFRDAARELEADQSEDAFDTVVKRVAKAPKPKDDGKGKNKGQKS